MGTACTKAVEAEVAVRNKIDGRGVGGGDDLESAIQHRGHIGCSGKGGWMNKCLKGDVCNECDVVWGLCRTEKDKNIPLMKMYSGSVQWGGRHDNLE